MCPPFFGAGECDPFGPQYIADAASLPIRPVHRSMLGLVKIDPRFLGWSLLVMRRLGDPLRWLERGNFFGGCTTVEREGETVVVVSALPASESVSGRLQVLETVPPPELLVVDPMAPLDLAVLLRSPGPNCDGSVPQSDLG